MNERDFIYWLQGYLELSNASELTAEQVQIVKDHIKLVMEKKTPSLPTIIQHPTHNHPPFFAPGDTVYCTSNVLNNGVTSSSSVLTTNGLDYQVDPYIRCHLTC